MVGSRFQQVVDRFLPWCRGPEHPEARFACLVAVYSQGPDRSFILLLAPLILPNLTMPLLVIPAFQVFERIDAGATH